MNDQSSPAASHGLADSHLTTAVAAAGCSHINKSDTGDEQYENRQQGECGDLHSGYGRLKIECEIDAGVKVNISQGLQVNA